MTQEAQHQRPRYLDFREGVWRLKSVGLFSPTYGLRASNRKLLFMLNILQILAYLL